MATETVALPKTGNVWLRHFLKRYRVSDAAENVKTPAAGFTSVATNPIIRSIETWHEKDVITSRNDPNGRACMSSIHVNILTFRLPRNGNALG